MRDKLQIIGNTVRRELVMSWAEKLLADLLCWLFGHIPAPSIGSVEHIGKELYTSRYCERCWKRGYRSSERVLLADTMLVPLCSDPEKSHGQTWTRKVRH